MALFEPALEYILEFEGGYTDGHDDLGGPTNKGISLNFLKHVPGYENADINTIRELTDDKIHQLYKEYFWLPIYEELREQWPANYIFDMAVNMGPANAHKIVQRSLWSIDPYARALIIDDGVFGPITLKYLNSYNEFYVQTALRAQRSGYYYAKVIEHPLQKNKIKGWLNRTYA